MAGGGTAEKAHGRAPEHPGGEQKRRNRHASRRRAALPAVPHHHQPKCLKAVCGRWRRRWPTPLTPAPPPGRPIEARRQPGRHRPASRTGGLSGKAPPARHSGIDGEPGGNANSGSLRVLGRAEASVGPGLARVNQPEVPMALAIERLMGVRCGEGPGPGPRSSAGTPR